MVHQREQSVEIAHQREQSLQMSHQMKGLGIVVVDKQVSQVMPLDFHNVVEMVHLSMYHFDFVVYTAVHLLVMALGYQFL